MASRMERYYNSEQRSKKNKDLYDSITELGNYTNIEGVIDISNSNEINIDNVKELIRKSQHQDKVVEEKEEIVEEQPEEEEKTYDVMDILNKAKIDHSDTDIRHRNLKRQQLEILTKLKKEHPENEDIDELLNTISLGGDVGDDLGIFDNLKSDTMVGEEAASIKKVLDDAKKIEQSDSEEVNVEKIEHTNLDDLDKSFYTSSFNFSDKDFEDLKNLGSNIQKNNKLIKMLIIIVCVLIAVGILVFVAKLIF